MGDRKDGKLLRDLDSMHFVVPVIYPNRCDNEAYVSERIELSAINGWLEKHNSDETDFPFKLFHLVVSAILKTGMLRPKMNRFIVNGNTYQRNYASASFVVKKKFSDSGEEALAIVYADGADTVFTMHDKIREQVFSCRSEKPDESTEAMNFINKLPRWLAKSLIKFVCVLDRHGRIPQSLIASDPYYSSVVLSNLGSIKLKCGYHHLTNWGTNSVFCVIGERRLRPVYGADGGFEMRDTVDLGLTIDERIADGYYFSRTMKLLKYLLEHPEELEKSFGEEVPQDVYKV